MSIRAPVCFIWLLVTLSVFSAAEVPSRRLARQLPPAAAESASLRSRHNDAVKGLLAALGLDTGESRTNVVLRTAAIARLTAAITNGTIRVKLPK